MKIYILSQALFLAVILLLTGLKIFLARSKKAKAVYGAARILVLLVMAFVQGYLRGTYELSEETRNVIYLIAAAVWLVFDTAANAVKRSRKKNDASA